MLLTTTEEGYTALRSRSNIVRFAVVCAAAALGAERSRLCRARRRQRRRLHARREDHRRSFGTHVLRPRQGHRQAEREDDLLPGRRLLESGTGLFSANIGTVVLGTVKNAPEYFGVTAKAKAGTLSRQTIAVVHAGASHAVVGTVTLKPGLSGGTFTGRAFGSKATISGSFTC